MGVYASEQIQAAVQLAAGTKFWQCAREASAPHQLITWCCRSAHTTSFNCSADLSCNLQPSDLPIIADVDLQRLTQAAELSQSLTGAHRQRSVGAGCFTDNTQQPCMQVVAQVVCVLHQVKQHTRMTSHQHRTSAADLPSLTRHQHTPHNTNTQTLSKLKTNKHPHTHSGVTAPHPNAGCLLFNPQGQLVGSGCQRAQGSTPSEVLAAAAAREAARGSTAYLNLETGDCHGEEAAVAALLQAGVSRVVVGLRHPLPHLRCAWVGWVCRSAAVDSTQKAASCGLFVVVDLLIVDMRTRLRSGIYVSQLYLSLYVSSAALTHTHPASPSLPLCSSSSSNKNNNRDGAISAYTAAGLDVAVLGDAPLHPGVDAADADAALLACLSANEALMHRAVLKRPLSVLKYAMTLDGKIATGAGVVLCVFRFHGWCMCL